MKRARLFVRSAAAVGVAIGLAAPSVPAATKTTAKTETPRRGGRITYVLSSESTSYDPIRLLQGATSADRGMQIYDTLLRLDGQGRIQPQLAESMTTTDGGTTWVMTLRRGVKFTDGTPFNATAVMFNVDRFRDPTSKFQGFGLVSDIVSMRVLDAHRVQFTLKAPNASFPIGFTTMAGMIGSPTAIKADPVKFGSNPVGAGPFMVKEWVRDDHLELVRNPNYFQKGKPYLDGITAKIVPVGQTAGLLMTARQADIALASATVLAQVQGDNGLYVQGGFSTGGEGVVPNFQKAPGNDPRIREAIALAFEPAVTSASLLQGLWKNPELTCPPFVKGDRECVPGLWPKPNVDRAKQLVSQYGADGHSLEVTLNGIQGNPSNEYIQQRLNNIGLKVTIRPLTVAAHVAALASGDFQIAWNAMSSFSTAYPKVYDNWHSGAINLPHHKLVDLDDALQRAKTSATDAARVKAWQDVQRAVVKNYAYIWYAPYVSGFVVQNKLRLGEQSHGTEIRFAGAWLAK